MDREERVTFSITVKGLHWVAAGWLGLRVWRILADEYAAATPPPPRVHAGPMARAAFEEGERRRTGETKLYSRRTIRDGGYSGDDR
jgi:hypothetical protein